MKRPYFKIDKKNKTIKILKPMTVLHLHRSIQEMLDNEFFNGNEGLDITDSNITIRINDKEIIIVNGWNIINKRDLKGKVIYEGNL